MDKCEDDWKGELHENTSDMHSRTVLVIDRTVISVTISLGNFTESEKKRKNPIYFVVSS